MTLPASTTESKIKSRKQLFGLSYGLVAGLAFSIALWGLDAYRQSLAFAYFPWTKFVTGAPLALMAGGEVNSTAVAKGIQYLLATQREDGTWDEQQYTGTGFPKYFMIKYHIYRNCFPLMALGTYRSLTEEKK